MTHGLHRERPRRGNRGRKSPQPAQAETLFDESTSGVRHDGASEGAHRRDEGAKRAEHGATAVARIAGQEAIERLAATGDPFSADDLHDLIEAEGGPTLPGALTGALFLNAARRGEIERVGWTTSDRPSRHGGPQRVWRGVSS